MNRTDAKAFLPLVKAYAEGKTLQCKYINGWEDLEKEPEWSMAPTQYRIKPESKTVPLTIEDLYEHFKAGIVFKNSQSYFKGKINGTSDTNIYIGSTQMSIELFIRHYLFEDGSPLTKIVEE